MEEDALNELKIRLGTSVVFETEKDSIGYDKDQAYLELMLRDVVIGDPETNRKRSTSVIIYGFPGSGKSTLVESTLGKLNRECPQFLDGKLVVRLSGILCIDLKSAVEEICSQLKLEDCEGAEEIFNDMENAANFDERLEQTMAFLKTNMESLKKSIIFVLDKIELFAEHPNQGLLYNLFDLAANSSSTIPLCIIGLTDRVDVLELFEKRVKSRFSHRQINLANSTYDFLNYKSIAEKLLRFNNFDIDKRFRRDWNANVKALFETIEVIRAFQNIYDTDKCILQLVSILFSVCCLAENSLTLTVKHFQTVFEENFRCNYQFKVALDLPITELIVLLSVYKQLQNNKQQAWQPSGLFRIVEKILKQFGLLKDDYFKAVSRLETLGLISPISTSQRNIGGVANVGDIYFKSELTIQELQDVWKKYPQLPSSFQELL